MTSDTLLLIRVVHFRRSAFGDDSPTQTAPTAMVSRSPVLARPCAYLYALCVGAGDQQRLQTMSWTSWRQAARRPRTPFQNGRPFYVSCQESRRKRNATLDRHTSRRPPGAPEKHIKRAPCVCAPHLTSKTPRATQGRPLSLLYSPSAFAMLSSLKFSTLAVYLVASLAVFAAASPVADCGDTANTNAVAQDSTSGGSSGSTAGPAVGGGSGDGGNSGGSGGGSGDGGNSGGSGGGSGDGGNSGGSDGGSGDSSSATANTNANNDATTCSGPTVCCPDGTDTVAALLANLCTPIDETLGVCIPIFGVALTETCCNNDTFSNAATVACNQVAASSVLS
ncbi:hypothetical protein FA95DRAFT_503048 [Auriscalpium vulgare]|uniref:Uncharacterized protein n=1 Tax=Auriscalpium vulgare TaxID=40419 RepID=A0ACB8RG64_9AGAM|nr:hypothetical protein FA95DRAFT_503048 [Auriscalpium vulgare]